ncbi:chorismate mutase [Snodgrassella sp. CFCC 13594]|uniref:chorismate mutase n=1 Tax=Snodgrassella sp. CFCC 13594 TaxID=1775559 RepID=UPI000834EA57|nr:chorismate mutase [Snodgrassella sp. CFCC 13594]
MIIVMQRQASEADIKQVIEVIRSRGLTEHISRGAERTIIGAVGDERVFVPRELEALPGVEKAMRVVQDWRIISRETQAQDTIITARGIAFGGHATQIIYPVKNNRLPESPVVFMDPYYRNDTPYAPNPQDNNAARDRELNQLIHTAHTANQAAVVRIRDVRQLESVLAATADILYLGGEQLANRSLRDEVGRLNVPVIVCKDKHHQIDDWLIAAEHIAIKGNHHIMLGEAGTLSLDRNAPYRLDIEAIVKAKRISHLPVVTNILRLHHAYLPESVLLALSQAAGADAVIMHQPSRN